MDDSTIPTPALQCMYDGRSITSSKFNDLRPTNPTKCHACEEDRACRGLHPLRIAEIVDSYSALLPRSGMPVPQVRGAPM